MYLLGLYVLFAPMVCALALVVVWNRRAPKTSPKDDARSDRPGRLDLDRQLSRFEFHA